MSGLFVTGTDTGVGKTVIAAALVLALRRQGLATGVCKPVQSGALAGDPSGDAALLARWTGVAETPEEIAPFAFAAPLAPLVAASLEGREVDEDSAVAHVRRLEERYEALVVEGAGGLLVPIGKTWTIAELAGRLGFPVVIVARAGLGTVNHTLLTAISARRLGLVVAGAILNGSDDGSATNARLIESFGDVPILGRTPWLEGELTGERLLDLAEEHLDVERLARVVKEKEATRV